MGSRRLRRRLAFAAPIVAIAPACERPIETRPVSPPAVVIADAGVDAPPVPRELVAALPPLGPYRSLDEMCRHARCNPPRPTTWPPPPPPPPQAVTVEVEAIAREEAGSRVRAGRVDPRIDRRWEATFVDRGGVPLEGGGCAIVAHDHEAIECTTGLAPEQLVTGRRTHRLRIVPPAPPPVAPTGTPRIVRVIRVRVRDSRSEVTIGIGSDAGITPAWKATLVRPNDTPIAGGECAPLEVHPHRSSCLVTLTMDQVRTLRVKLTPP